MPGCHGATRSMATLALAALALPAAALYALSLPRWLVAAAAAAHPGVVFRVPLRRRRLVALTLDDAPGELTPALLALLAAHGARATFFVIADAAARHPERLAAIAAHGHELGNHMQADEPSWRLSPREFAAQVAAVETLLAQHRPASHAADAAPRRWFRPGHGVFRPHMMATLRSHGLTGALGSAYGWDPRNTRGWLIARLLLRSAAPGAVMVAHDGCAARRATLEALQVVLPELARRGIEVVTLSELVAAAEEEAVEAAAAAHG